MDSKIQNYLFDLWNFPNKFQKIGKFHKSVFENSRRIVSSGVSSKFGLNPNILEFVSTYFFFIIRMP